jgi:hypothetical protein
MFKKKDLFIIVPFLVAAGILAIWFNFRPSSSGIAVVEKNGKEVYRFDLSKQKSTQIIDVGGSMNIKLLLEPGAISFYHSDCPDQICVRTGKLTKPGQVAVCLPGKVSVRIISSNSEKKFDGYTG